MQILNLLPFTAPLQNQRIHERFPVLQPDHQPIGGAVRFMGKATRCSIQLNCPRANLLVKLSVNSQIIVSILTFLSVRLIPTSPASMTTRCFGAAVSGVHCSLRFNYTTSTSQLGALLFCLNSWNCADAAKPNKPSKMYTVAVAGTIFCGKALPGARINVRFKCEFHKI